MTETATTEDADPEFGTPSPQERLQQDKTRALEDAETALVLAMRAHGLDKARTAIEFTERVQAIVAAACETQESRAVVLTQGSLFDARRLADAVVAHDPAATTTEYDTDEGLRVIHRMVTKAERRG
jgi:hypothetical protein